jgi:hypothetical protein
MFSLAKCCVVSAAFLLTSLNVAAGTVELLGRLIDPVIPNGYCEVGGHSADTDMVNRTKEAIGSSNRILLLFADCKELSEFRKGKRNVLDNYGQILAQTPKGQLRALKGVSRQEFVKKMAAQSDYIPDALQKAETRAKQYIPGYQRQESLGLLTADANGLYVGLLMTLTGDAGQPRPIVGIFGMTIVKDLVLSINIYQAYQATPDLRGLLSKQQNAMDKFVRANN